MNRDFVQHRPHTRTQLRNECTTNASYLAIPEGSGGHDVQLYGNLVM